MARARLSLVPISLLLLASLAAAAATAAAAADPEEGDLRISVQYATEEESRWMDRWAEKYKAQGPAGKGFKIQPATDEESARINSMFTGGGYDGHIEFDDDHPFGRMVVDAFHSRPRPSKPNENDDLQKQNLEDSHSRAEHDIKDL